MPMYTIAEVDRIAKSLKVKGQPLNKALARVAILEDCKKFEEEKAYDIFMSHSYTDAKTNEERIYALKSDIESMGFSVYVDWIEDSKLDRSKVTKETADILKLRMNSCNSLLFLTSETSSASKWMPWELGYFDGVKSRVAILPVLESQSSSYKGQEYLGLYPYIKKAGSNLSKKDTLWVHSTVDHYISLREWLKGNNPYKRD